MLARAAYCDVTPRDRPVRLAGYAARRAPVSTVLDPIEISAVLLEASGRRCVIFSFDLMVVGAELQQAIHSALAPHGFSPARIVLLASHTHFAPATDRACAPLGVPDERFVADLAAASENLVQQMLREPPAESSLQINSSRLNHSISRRRYWPFPTAGRTYGFQFGSTVMAPDPDGPRDEVATVLLLRRVSDGAVVAAIWHYTCHGTAVTPPDVISADFPGRCGGHCAGNLATSPASLRKDFAVTSVRRSTARTRGRVSADGCADFKKRDFGADLSAVDRW